MARARGWLSPGQWLAVVVLAGSGMAAFGIAPDSTLDARPPEVAVNRELPRPSLEPVGKDDGYWSEGRVERGDTIGRLLSRVGVEDPEAIDFVRGDPIARTLYQLRPGKSIRVKTDANGRLLALRFVAGTGDLLTIARTGSMLRASAGPAPAEIRWKIAAGEIRSSLFAAADAADLPDPITRQLADVFAADIDFHHDLQRGDHFGVVYEMRYVDGEPVGTGRIVAAEFVNDGVAHRAFLWRGPDGHESYYTQDGTPLRKTFLRSPMEFSRMTSGFTQARFHPILQEWRAHKGVDYAAPVGTPVHATADGKIVFAGVQNGYGNVVQIQHEGVYSTLYAHLEGFAPGLRNGGRVAQGEVIGFVGQTGWATGPHLHYEFRVNNEQQDPVAVGLPNADPLTPAKRPEFLAAMQRASAELAVAQTLPARLLAGGD